MQKREPASVHAALSLPTATPISSNISNGLKTPIEYAAQIETVKWPDYSQGVFHLIAIFSNNGIPDKKKKFQVQQRTTRRSQRRYTPGTATSQLGH